MAITVGSFDDDTLYGDDGFDIIQGLDGNDHIYGREGNDIIQGNEGNDQLHGEDGDDIIQGNEGNDRIWGGEGNDVMQGGAGNDSFRDSSGSNYFDGGEGRDSVSFEDLTSSGVKLNLAAGTGSYTNDQGEEVKQTLISIERALGTNSDDELIGNEADNAFFGLDGDDTYVGGAGNDTFRDTSGSNSFNGGAGRDTVVFQDLQYGVKVNLDQRTGSYTDGNGQEINQTLISIERVAGTSYDDELIGNNASNTFYDFGGNDTYVGGAGNDTFADGTGSNHFDGGTGNDTVDFKGSSFAIKVNLAEETGSYTNAEGEEVEQTLISIERLHGTNYDDEIIGNEANNSFYGGYGNDTYAGGAGNDVFRDSEGSNSFDGGEGIDLVTFQDLQNLESGIKVNLVEETSSYTNAEGEEIIQAVIDIERVYGTFFDDELIGNEENNLLLSYEGNDTLVGGAGNDRITTGGGDNTINAGSGVDNIYLGDGNNTVIQTAGQGYDRVRNFQLGSTRFDAGDPNTLTFEASGSGVNIKDANGDRLAYVYNTDVSTFTDNLDDIFIQSW